MRTSLQLHLTTLVALALGALSLPKTASAAVFNQQEIDQNRVIAVAAPYNNGNAHQLLILEQVANTRSCWSESGNNPRTVDPLLGNFDFTGICNRSTDSNGYSVRVGGKDLGWQYSLRLVERDNDQVLVAVSNVDRTSPELEVGRTYGVSRGFSKIVLNPGWRLTKRSYNGVTQGHFYLTNEQPLTTLIADASATKTNSPAPTTTGSSRPAPVSPLPRPQVNPPVAVKPSQPVVVVPTVPVQGSTSTSGTRLPPVVVPTTPPARPLPPAPPSRPIVTLPPAPTSTATSGFNYRVIVATRTLNEQNQVKAVVPSAFRTTVNGRSVMQAGLFKELDKANEVYQALTSKQLQATVVPVRETDVVKPIDPPVVSPRPVPNGRVVVVVDPGHGGGDPGAVGIGGLQEKEAVLSIARQVVSFLGQQGLQASLTRSSDEEIDLEPRVKFAEQANADVFVSIHANSISLSRPDISGLETYYNSPAGQELAQVIHRAILEDVGMQNRGVRKANFYVIKYTSMPAVLVEVGFVTGSEDAARLSSASGRSQLAKAIARGIAQYVQGQR